MCEGVVVYRESHKYEHAFYSRVCKEYKLYPLPVSEPAKSFRSVRQAIENSGAKPNVFVVHRGIRSYFGDFEGKANQEGWKVYHIEERSQLLNLLTRDETAFKKARGTDFPKLDSYAYCAKVVAGDAELQIPYEEWVGMLDLKKVIACQKNKEAFGELAKVLDLLIM